MNSWRAKPVPARLFLVVLSQVPLVLAVWLWGYLVGRVSSVEYDGGVFLLGLAFVLSLFLYGISCYLAFCALSIRYVLEGDFLTMRCGFAAVQVPLTSISRIHVGGDLIAERAIEVRWRGVAGLLPGYVVGEGRSPQLGRVFSMATAPAARQVWLVARGMSYGVSPEYPDQFAQRIKSRLEVDEDEDDEDEDEPESLLEPARPAPPSRVFQLGAGLWVDRPIRLLFLAGLVLNALLWGYLSLAYNQLPTRVALHWNAQAEIDRIGDPVELLDLPLFALGVWLFNSIAARLVLPRERAATLFFLAGGVAAQVFFFAGALSIVLKN